jgi:hypothetical protein
MQADLGDGGDQLGYDEVDGVLHVVPLGDDWDGDGMPNAWESAHGLDPSAAGDAAGDPDNDLLGNLEEYQQRTDPNLPDTDADGMPDGWEAGFGLDPTVDDAGADADDDTATNLQEYLGQTDPRDPDSRPGAGTLLFDDFNDGDDTASPPWTRWTGQWSVDGAQYHQSESRDNAWSVAGDPGWTDYRVEVALRMMGARASGSGPMFRVQDATNLYLFEVSAGSDRAQLWRYLAGDWTLLADEPLAGTLVAGSWHSLAVDLEGTSITGSVDGAEVLAVEDGAFLGGRIGVNAGDEVFFDDVRVTHAGPAANLSPVAQAQAVPTSGPAPLVVAFDGSGVDSDGTIAAYAWDFGDGGTASTPDATHLYQRPGSHVARLTVIDDQGASGTASVTLLVFDPAGTGAPASLVGGCGCTTSTSVIPWIVGVVLLLRRRRPRALLSASGQRRGVTRGRPVGPIAAIVQPSSCASIPICRSLGALASGLELGEHERR